MKTPKLKNAIYSQSMRELAFDLYRAGFTRAHVHGLLHKRYPNTAPGYSTVCRWAIRDRWTERSNNIRKMIQQRVDSNRAISGANSQSINYLDDPELQAIVSDADLKMSIVNSLQAFLRQNKRQQASKANNS